VFFYIYEIVENFQLQKFYDESIKQVHESLRRLEHLYLKYDDKQILFFDPVCDGK
jgi:hypothetical protein